MNLAIANAPQLNDAAAAMLTALNAYLPPAIIDLPGPSVSVASMTEKAVGIGRNLGGDTTGMFAAVSLKGVRLDALARFQVWAAGPDEADQAIGNLNTRLMGDRDNLRSAGFLRLGLEIAPPADAFPDTVGGWRRYADYRVLYEFAWRDTDGAQGLIARIPVSINSGLGEFMSITDEMTRWDNLAAPMLAIRGPGSVGGLALLAFLPSPLPGKPVTMTRTYDGAPGHPTKYATLAKFLATVAGAAPSVRHASVTFPSFAAFRAAFRSDGDAIDMGDWNRDGIPDRYQPLSVAIDPAIELPATRDRFEVSYAAPKFEKTAVVYLRATR